MRCKALWWTLSMGGRDGADLESEREVNQLTRGWLIWKRAFVLLYGDDISVSVLGTRCAPLSS